MLQVGQSGVYTLKATVVLVGMMGSGKSAIGKVLAARLDVPFLDSDAAIEEAAALSIAEIFARDGEPFFRKREAEVIGRLLGTSHVSYRQVAVRFSTKASGRLLLTKVSRFGWT